MFCVGDPEAEEILSNIVDYVTRDDNPNDEEQVRAILGEKTAGPGCSKLTTSLVNVSLKFQMVISQIRQYFWFKKWDKLAKASLIFSTKNISVFGNKDVKHLIS